MIQHEAAGTGFATGHVEQIAYPKVPPNDFPHRIVTDNLR